MIKKILATVIVLNSLLINLIANNFYPKINIDQNIARKIVDIKTTNDLINTYSNLVLSIVPANE